MNEPHVRSPLASVRTLDASDFIATTDHETVRVLSLADHRTKFEVKLVDWRTERPLRPELIANREMSCVCVADGRRAWLVDTKGKPSLVIDRSQLRSPNANLLHPEARFAPLALSTAENSMYVHLSLPARTDAGESEAVSSRSSVAKICLASGQLWIHPTEVGPFTRALDASGGESFIDLARPCELRVLRFPDILETFSMSEQFTTCQALDRHNKVVLSSAMHGENRISVLDFLTGTELELPVRGYNASWLDQNHVLLNCPAGDRERRGVSLRVYDLQNHQLSEVIELLHPGDSSGEKTFLGASEAVPRHGSTLVAWLWFRQSDIVHERGLIVVDLENAAYCNIEGAYWGAAWLAT